MNLPKRNSADGRCYWMKLEVQEELQPLFDQCIQDAIERSIMRLLDPHLAAGSGQQAKARPLRCGNCFGHGPKRSGPRPLTRKRPSPSANTCFARAGGVKLTTIYLICCNGSYRRNILS